MSNTSKANNWWERSGNLVPFPKMRQGNLPHCVYAAIAGGINHILRRTVWTAQSLYAEHQKNGPRDADFGVAVTAMSVVPDEVEKHHHNKDWASEGLSPDRIREWLEDGSVVILSMELRNDPVSNRGGWHMFSIVAFEQDQFQVWDTNGFEGFLTDAELSGGFSYPNGWFFMPHNREDTLVLKLKN